MSFSNNFPTTSPSLELDFANVGALDPRITFARANPVATVTNQLGLIQTVAANTPRFDYDPVTLAAKGLLIEEQRTNLCLYSAGVGGTGWNNTNAGTGVLPVSTTNFAVAPDGTTTASRVQVSLGGGTTSTDQSITAQTLTGTSCRGSFYIKTNDGSSKTIYVRGQNAANITVDGTWRRYDFDAGTLSGTQFGVGLRGGQTPTNSDTADLLVWGAQLEAGAFPTSYIPTVASQVTRSSDVASVNTLSPWFNATEGTLFSQWDSFSVGAISPASVALVDTANPTNITVNLWQTTTVRAFWGTNSINTLAAVQSINSAAIAFSNASYAISANGASVISGSGTVAIASINQMNIGRYVTNPGYLNGHIRRITYYPRRLSNAELQAITL